MGLLRIFLAFGVLVEHANLYETFHFFSIFKGGYEVPVFFMISGFYMAMVLNTKYEQSLYGNISFYVARYLRIWPTYIVVLIIFISLKPIGDISNISLLFQYFIYAVAFLIIGYELLQWFAYNSTKTNIFPTDSTQITDNNITLDMLIYMRPMWSVSIELLFYAIAPYFVRSLKILIIFFFFFLIIHYLLIYNYPYHHPYVYRNSINYFYLFGLGSLMFFLYQKLKSLNKEINIYVSILLFVLLINFQFSIYLLRNYLEIDIRIAQDMLFLLVAFCIPFLFDLSKKNITDKIIGDFSYPLYIVHWPILYFLREYKGTEEWFFYAVVASFTAAILLEILVAKPMDIFRSYIAKKIMNKKRR